MTFMVPLAMFGWIPLGLLLFALLPPRRAIIAAFLIGWLFLPQAGYAIQALPDYTRITAVPLVVLAGVAFFDTQRLLSFRPSWYDIPVLVWCLRPLASSISNGLGAYDGLSGVFGSGLVWGVPYIIGRVYFGDRDSIRVLALGIFIGGLIYMPLCLWEIRMSPQLHGYLYGYHQVKFHTTWRLGGYRPLLFMHNGLEVGLWMAITSLTGIWLWRTGSVKRLWNIPIGWLASALVVTAIMCRSLGALALLTLGVTVLFASKYTRSRLPLLALILLPAIYVGLRATGTWYPHAAVSAAQRIDEVRAQSFESRLYQEVVLAERAWLRPVFGWGSWGRNRVRDEAGESVVVTDSLWIITFGQQGLVGLVSLGLLFALPALLLCWRIGARGWSAAPTAAAGALAVGVTLYAGDCLMNAMLNPVYHVIPGAVMGVAISHSPADEGAAARATSLSPQRRELLVGHG